MPLVRYVPLDYLVYQHRVSLIDLRDQYAADPMLEPNALPNTRFAPLFLLRATLHLVAAVALCSAPCVARIPGALPDSSIAPVIRLDSPVLEFGGVLLFGADTLAVAVSSAGTDSVGISGVQHLGPDTASFRVLQINPQVLHGSERGFISIQFVPKQPGATSDTIVLQHTGVGGGDTLVLTGYGLNVTIDPTVLDIGDVPVDSCWTDTIEITNREEGAVVMNWKLTPFPPIQISSFAVVSPVFQIDTIDSGGVYRVVVQFCPQTAGRDSALWSGTIGDSGTFQVKIIGTGVRKSSDTGKVEISTTTVGFGCVPVGRVDTRSFTIANKTSSAVPFVGVNSAPPLPFSLDPIALKEIPPDSFMTVVVQFAPTASGRFSDSVIVRVGAEDFLVHLTGEGRSTTLDISPGSVDFGTISMCDPTVTRTLDLINSTCFEGALSISFTSGGNDFYVVNPGATPRALFPDSGYRIVVGCNPRLGVMSDTMIVRFDTNVYVVPVTANVIRPQIALVGKDSVRFPDVAVGTRDSVTIVVRNVGDVVGSIDSYRIVGPANGFSITPVIPYKPVLDPQVETGFTIIFAPTDDVEHTASVEIVTGCNGMFDTIVVWLTGKGVGTSGRDRTVTVTSTEVEVGKRFTIDVRVSPPVTDAEGVNGYQASLYIDPKSFYVHDVTEPLVSVGWNHEKSGRLSVTRLPQGPLIDGDLLFTIELEGLSSGSSDNVVTVDSISLIGLAPRPFDPSSYQVGHIVLTGCDVDRGIAFSKATAVRTIRPNPVGSHATVEYVAARGSQPSIEIFDLMGRPSRHIDLPVGTGREQSVEIGVEGLPPGGYLLQLRMESERSTVLMIVDQ